jgi:hypothetical protein
MRIFVGDGQPCGSWEIVHKELLWAGFAWSPADVTRICLQRQAVAANLLPRCGEPYRNPGVPHGSA